MFLNLINVNLYLGTAVPFEHLIAAITVQHYCFIVILALKMMWKKKLSKWTNTSEDNTNFIFNFHGRKCVSFNKLARPLRSWN